MNTESDGNGSDSFPFSEKLIYRLLQKSLMIDLTKYVLKYGGTAKMNNRYPNHHKHRINGNRILGVQLIPTPWGTV